MFPQETLKKKKGTLTWFGDFVLCHILFRPKVFYSSGADIKGTVVFVLWTQDLRDLGFFQI